MSSSRIRNAVIAVAMSAGLALGIAAASQGSAGTPAAVSHTQTPRVFYHG